MSQVNDFLEATRLKVDRGSNYPVVAKRTNKPRWPAGSSTKSESPAGFTPLQPFIGVESYSDQIRQVLVNYYRFVGKAPSRRVFDRQVELLANFYKDLKRLGFDVQDVTAFSLKHGKALLGMWQAKGCGTNTVYCRWSVLRSWSRVLGKHGMLPALKELQPGFQRGGDPQIRSRILSAHDLKVRSDYLASKPDKTVYLVDRLVRELDITREEALELDLDGVQVVVEGEATVLRVGTAGHRKVIQHIRMHLPLMMEVRDFMLARNRKKLAWSDMDVDAAMHKYSLRLSYVTRVLFPKEG